MVRYQKERKLNSDDDVATEEFDSSLLIKFKSDESDENFNEVEVPVSICVEELNTLLNSLLPDKEINEKYSFSILNGVVTVKTSLFKALKEAKDADSSFNTENTVLVNYFSQTPFRVNPTCRFSGALKGHTGAVLCLQFSPTSTYLVTGSADRTLRVWDVLTKTCICVLEHHKSPVMCCSFSFCNNFIASGSMDKTVCIWSIKDFKTGAKVKPTSVLSNHKDTVTCMAFSPVFFNDLFDTNRSQLAVGCKDGSIVIWDIISCKKVKQLNSHNKMVTCIKWSSFLEVTYDNTKYEGPFLVSSSRDTTVLIWSYKLEQRIKLIKNHGHWVNYISLSTDYLVRHSAFYLGDPLETITDVKDIVQHAKKLRNNYLKTNQHEYLISCSDDNTICLYDLLNDAKRIEQLYGHRKTVFQAMFSPNTRYIASVSGDNSVKLWDGKTGKYLHSFFSHVGPVFQLAWSADSRMIVTCSKDTTIKIFDVFSRKLKSNLPGSTDEIYVVDWSVDGQAVASAGFDSVVRFWSA